MNILAIISAILTLTAGIGVFLVACQMMSGKLESAGSKRLSLDVCNQQVGTEYISLAQNAERVAEHLINVGKTIRDLQER